MNFKSTLPVFALIATLLALPGCGKGFSAASVAGSGTNGSSSTGDDFGGRTPSSAESAFKQYPTDGVTNDGAGDDQRQVLEIDKVNKILIVHLPIGTNIFLDGANINVPIKEIPGASVVVGPNAAGKTEVTLRVPLSHVLHGIDFLPPTRLPNGDPLPAVAEGELPSVAVQLSNLGNIKASIYLAPSVVGIFVNSPINPYIAVTVPVRNKAKTKTWGYFSTVPVKGSYQGGFFISVALPNDLARLIDDVL